jgi:hypothetical protein
MKLLIVITLTLTVRSRGLSKTWLQVLLKWMVLFLCCYRWTNATNTWAHPIRSPVGIPRMVVFMNKVDMVDDEELLGVGWNQRFVIFLRIWWRQWTSYSRVCFRWLNSQSTWVPKLFLNWWKQLMLGSKSQLETLKAFLDAWRCILNTGRGTVATGRIETGLLIQVQLKSLVWELKINFYYYWSWDVP